MKKETRASETIKKVKKKLDRCRRAVFTKSDLQNIVIENLPDVGANQRTIIKGTVLNYLWETEKLKEVIFEFPSRKETRYLFGNITDFELAQSLKPKAYLAHRAAVFINGLCDDFPKTIHINVEQAHHHRRNNNTLTQGAIDRAFNNKGRVSNDIAEANGVQVCITRGQKTDGLGVVTKKGPHGESITVTNLERTLIDIAVRPAYSGGPAEVLKAYRKATDLSVEKLFTMLVKMNFVYPYHQAIGFYLEASGNHSMADIAGFKSLPTLFDFYLDYRIKKPKFSEQWKLHYPADLMI